MSCTATNVTNSGFVALVALVALVATLAAVSGVAAQLPTVCDTSSTTDPCTIPTFESISIYWKPSDSTGAPCAVRFRVNPEFGQPGPWRDGLDLWFDDRTGDTADGYAGPSWRQEEYRGSIVALQSGTRYEIELSIQGGSTVTVFEETWPETFPEAPSPHIVDGPFRIAEGGGGTADAYEVYVGNGPITADNVEDSTCVRVSAPYVIVRGLTMTGGEHGVVIEPGAHHVIIEDCDISDWGIGTSSEWGAECAGIFLNDGMMSGYDDPEDPLDSRSIAQIVVQRNRIHHPRFDTNCWCESNSANASDPLHPYGPQGILIRNPLGNNVIRYNEIYSDNDHRMADGIGGASNYSFFGCPGRDSDIYGNWISNVWDDAVETEGGNTNVRVWGNYVDEYYAAFACAATATGPLYIWRNVADRSDKYDETALLEIASADSHSCWKDSWEQPIPNVGRFLKTTAKVVYTAGNYRHWGGGRVYLFHNTLLQRPNDPMDDNWEWDPWPGEIDQGPAFGLASCHISNFVTRNNLLQVVDTPWYSLIFPSSIVTMQLNLEPNDFNYDMLNGVMNMYSVSCSVVAIVDTNDVYEPDGWYSYYGEGVTPTWAELQIPERGEAGVFWLAPGSAGADSAEAIANFNDGDMTVGGGPDLGAHEYGTPPMYFGLNGAMTSVPVDDGHDTSKSRVALLPCRPNPGARGTTTITYILQCELPVSIDIFDVSGRRVRVLKSEQVEQPGRHDSVWDGLGDDGCVVASGVYFCRVRAGVDIGRTTAVLLK